LTTLISRPSKNKRQRWIDAEGHDLNVLAGAGRLLARDRPLIYTEVNIWCLSAFAGHSPGALVRKLWEAFEVGKPEKDGQISPLPDAYGFLHDTMCTPRALPTSFCDRGGGYSCRPCQN
jgi:hypothetical protein